MEYLPAERLEYLSVRHDFFLCRNVTDKLSRHLIQGEALRFPQRPPTGIATFYSQGKTRIDMWKPAPRQAQTTLPCAACKKPMMVRRTCHYVYLSCDHCNREVALQDCIKDMDPALERFLEEVNCDRV